MFGVDALGERVRDLQMAKYYGWTLNDIEDMTEQQYNDAYGYMGAVAKMSEVK